MANHTTLSQDNFVERISSLTAVTPTSFLVSPSSTAPLLEINANSFHSAQAVTTTAAENSYIQTQHVQPNAHSHQHSATTSSSSYTFLQIKREPCQVSEITTSNHHHQQQEQSSGKNLATGSAAASSTLTTVVKIESSSPKNHNGGCNVSGSGGSGVNTAAISTMEKSINNVPVGIAIARKRQQEQNTIPTTIQRDCFGIRVGELNSVAPSNACANIFFAGNDLTTNPNQDNLLASPNIQNVGRTASSFWQYPTTGPLDSVLQMPLPPAGFQYARDANRGQLLLFPATPGIAEPIPQTYVWPYMHTASTNAIQATSNFLFPPLTTATAATAAAPQTSPFVPFQIYGSNYLATASTTLHHHTQTHGTRLVAFSATENKPKNQIQPPPLTPITNKCNNNNPIMKIEDMQTTPSHNFGTYPKSIVLPQQQVTQPSQQITPTGPPPLQAFTNFVDFEKDKIQSMPIQLTTATQATSIESHGTPVLPMPVMQTPVIPSISTTTTTQSFLPHQIHSEANDSIVYKQPEMQDVNIQTDTPIMSEEENTLGPDECVFQINKQPIFETNNEVITSSTVEGECDEISKQQEEDPVDTEILLPCSHNELPPPQQQPEDLTGLELLSAASFESNKIVIKQEKFDTVPDTNNDEESLEAIQETTMLPPPQPPQLPCEQLGGLKLLCALAEQRIHEEAGGSLSPTPPDIESLPPIEPDKEGEFKEKVKKKKRKHSKSSKSSKKKSGNRKHNHESNEYSSSDEIEADMKSAFKKAQYKFMKHHKCSYSEKHCRSKCNWPDPEEFFQVFESNMRSKLAYLTKQYKKKKRKLNAFNKIHKKKKQSEREVEPTQPKTQSRIFGTIASSENDDTLMTSSDRDRDKEDNSSPSFMMGASGQTKPWKPYGLDIMRNKKILNEFKFTSTKPAATESNDPSPQKKIKEEKPSTTFLSGCGSATIDRCEDKEKKVCSKFKKHKQIKEERTIVLKSPTLAHIEKQKEINKKLMLTNEHLYKNKIRVLTHMGGLFYAGYLSPLQPPDVYAVALDGERGNKSHIMSREEVLKDTILELSPSSLEEVKPGTRVCAYWSQQYRCLYPGRAAALVDSGSSPSTSTDTSSFLSVEFDDGDSGRIRLENIRFLMSDYPNVEYDNSPLTTSFAKPKDKENSPAPQASYELSPKSMSPKAEIIDDLLLSDGKEQEKRKSTSRKHKSESEEMRKHRKHKKRKKHKKHRKNIYEVVSTTQEEPVLSTSILEQSEQSQESLAPPNSETSSPSLPSEEMEVIVEPAISNTTVTLNEEDDEIASRDNDNSSNYSSIDKNDEKKARSSQKDHSKIAAFLPARQLWKWLGQPYKKPAQKGRVKKSFYKSIQRGKEIITVGDSAVFLSTGRPDRPYIGRIESMWETSTSNKVVRVKWFYHPEETMGCPKLKFPGALFESPHEDENDVQTISHKCEVLAFEKYEEKFGPDPNEYHFIYDNNDTYYLAGHYNPKTQCLKLNPSTPVLK